METKSYAAVAASTQVVAYERAAFEAHYRKDCGMPEEAQFNWEASYIMAAWDGWQAGRAALGQTQEPFMFGIMKPDGKAHIDENCVGYDAADLNGEVNSLNDSPDTGYSTVPVYLSAARTGTLTLTGHQLRMAIDLINPGGHQERDELDDELTFGIRMHESDDHQVSTGMCCWNGDTDGVLPLDGEYEVPVAPVPRATAPAGSLVEVLREVRHSLQFANDSVGGGITDTIWMMNQPETVFDYIDAALESPLAQEPHWHIAADNVEACALQKLLTEEFACYRVGFPAGMMAWATAALLDCSPHRISKAQGDASGAARDVIAERRRQIEKEGYSHENDDVYVNDEIAAFAAFYVMPPAAREWPAEETGFGATWGEAITPVDWSAAKPGDRRQELVKAGALVIAEIERFDRAAIAAGKAVNA